MHSDRIQVHTLNASECIRMHLNGYVLCINSIVHIDPLVFECIRMHSDGIQMFFRFVTSGEIRKRSEFFEPFIAGLTNSTVDQVHRDSQVLFLCCIFFNLIIAKASFLVGYYCL